MHRKSIIYWPYDRWIIICTVLLLAFGLLMVTSASMVIADRQFGCPFHYFIRHLIYLGFGLILVWTAGHIPIKMWEKCSGYLFLFGFLLLVLVLIPMIGKSVNGSRRWIQLGSISLQVSEVVKFVAILYLASFLQRYQNEVRNELKGFLKPMLLVILLSGLLLLEPDFGAVVVITIMYMMLLFLAGVRLWPFFVF